MADVNSRSVSYAHSDAFAEMLGSVYAAGHNFDDVKAYLVKREFLISF